MSQLMLNEMKAYGVSSVLVFLKPDAVGEPVLQHFSRFENSQTSALAAAVGARRGAVPAGRYYPNLGVLLGTVNRDGLAALRSDQRVRRVASAPPLRLIRPVSRKSAKLTDKLTWGIERLGIPELWKEGLTGKGIRVGHLDTGADGKHPALRDAIVSFAEFDWLGRKTRDATPRDTQDHGTHTAGTIAGRPVAGRAIGMAPKADLCSALVIEGGDVVARVLGGMDWVVGQGCKVLSMSLGFPGFWDDFLQLTRILRQRGVLPVFAVGNEGPGTSRSPGNYAEALSVGASAEDDTVADFSSSDRFRRRKDPVVPDVLAPGVGVVSALPGGGYQSMSGTSMATPHVAGLAALLWEAKPAATPNQVEKAIFESCVRLEGVPVDRQGRGVPVAKRALQRLMGRDLGGRRHTTPRRSRSR
jgi:subtilisin